MKTQNFFLTVILLFTGLFFLPIHSMRLNKLLRPAAGRQGTAFFKNNEQTFFAVRFLATQCVDVHNNDALHEDCGHLPLQDIRKRYFDASSAHKNNFEVDNQELSENEYDEASRESQKNYLHLEQAKTKCLNAILELHKKRSNNKSIGELDQTCREKRAFYSMCVLGLAGLLGSIYSNPIAAANVAVMCLGGAGGYMLGGLRATKYSSLINSLSEELNKAVNNYKKLLEDHKKISEFENKKCKYTLQDIHNYKVESFCNTLCVTCKKPFAEMKECPCSPKQAEEEYISYLVKIKDV
jgi:hypothetical protein